DAGSGNGVSDAVATSFTDASPETISKTGPSESPDKVSDSAATRTSPSTGLAVAGAKAIGAAPTDCSCGAVTTTDGARSCTHASKLNGCMVVSRPAASRSSATRSAARQASVVPATRGPSAV